MTGNDRLRHVFPAGIAAVGIVAGIAGWLGTSSLQQDFAAYWVAGAARNAGLDPYVNHVGGTAAPELWDGVSVFAHSRFLYPPLVAELFRPFALMPYLAAKAVFTMLAVGAWILAAVLAARGARRGAGVMLVAGALTYPLYLHLERGQVDLFVLVALAVALDARARPGRAAGALAVAAAIKPTLLLLVPVVAALGRWRVAVAAIAGLALIAVASVLVSGPALAREYATDVLPRAALYGEGGDESMLLPEARLGARQADLEAGIARIDGRVYPQAAWERPASASVPRLLAPAHPSRAVTRGTALAFLLGLVAVALAVRRRGAAPIDEALVSWAAAVACVVASPAGWIMGFVWALPLVPWLARARAEARGSRRRWWLVVVAGAACAMLPPFPGWAAAAGTALVVAAAALALSSSRRVQEAT